jgi:hypothetical protein
MMHQELVCRNVALTASDAQALFSIMNRARMPLDALESMYEENSSFLGITARWLPLQPQDEQTRDISWIQQL